MLVKDGGFYQVHDLTRDYPLPRDAERKDRPRHTDAELSRLVLHKKQRTNKHQSYRMKPVSERDIITALVIYSVAMTALLLV